MSNTQTKQVSDVLDTLVSLGLSDVVSTEWKKFGVIYRTDETTDTITPLNSAEKDFVRNVYLKTGNPIYHLVKSSNDTYYALVVPQYDPSKKENMFDLHQDIVSSVIRGDSLPASTSWIETMPNIIGASCKPVNIQPTGIKIDHETTYYLAQ